MTTWKCTTCGAIDSRIANADNACCGECGDTEGLEEVSYGIGLTEYGYDPDKMFPHLDEARVDPEDMQPPNIRDVGLWHWLVHKFGWNEGHVVTIWDDGHLGVYFKCDTCGYIEGYTGRPPEPFFSQERVDWPTGLYPKDFNAEELKDLLELQNDNRDMYKED